MDHTGLKMVDSYVELATNAGLDVAVKEWTIPAETLESTGTVMVPPHRIIQVTVTVPDTQRFAHGRTYVKTWPFKLVTAWGRFDAPGRHGHYLSGSAHENKRISLVPDVKTATFFLQRMSHLLAHETG